MIDARWPLGDVVGAWRAWMPGQLAALKLLRVDFACQRRDDGCMERSRRPIPGASRGELVRHMLAMLACLLAVCIPAFGAGAGAVRASTLKRGLGGVARARSICEYHTLTRSEPTAITLGPDGALWFTEAFGRIGRISIRGRVKEFRLPLSLQSPSGIVTGPDGALWFTAYDSAAIGRITPSGQISRFGIPSSPAEENGPEPDSIAVGADGALWFTEPGANMIGRITTAGTYSSFRVPGRDPLPNTIVRDPDGAMWFTEYNANKIGRITTSGKLTGYRVPTRASVPFAITAGPHHALWFTESRGSKIGTINTAGKIREYRLPHHDRGDLFGIAAGPDHALWFTESSDDRIARLTTKGKFTEYHVLTPVAIPESITTGPDGAMWFTEQHQNGAGADGNRSNTIGRIATRPKPGSPTRCRRRQTR